MKRHYASIFIGGGYFACGAAVSNGNSLVVEPSVYPGSDFAAGFHPGTDYARPEHPFAVEFHEELIRRKVIVGGFVHPVAMTPVFALWCIRHEVNLLLSSAATEISGNSLTVFSTDGLHTFTADRIIDLRPDETGRKYLTALVYSPSLPPGRPGLRFYPLLPGNEFALELELPGAATWEEARRKLAEACRRTSKERPEMRLLFTGTGFHYKKYPNAVTALDCGLRSAENGV